MCQFIGNYIPILYNIVYQIDFLGQKIFLSILSSILLKIVAYHCFICPFTVLAAMP